MGKTESVLSQHGVRTIGLALVPTGLPTLSPSLTSSMIVNVSSMLISFGRMTRSCPVSIVRKGNNQIEGQGA